MRKSFSDEQSKPTWQSFEQQQQQAEFEKPYYAPSTLDPSLLGRSSYDPAGTFRQPSWSVPQFQVLPSWGWQSATDQMSKALPSILNDAKEYQGLKTTGLANQIGQNYLNDVLKGGQAKVSYANGALQIDPYAQSASKALYDTGNVRTNQGANPGTQSQPLPGTPQSTPPAPGSLPQTGGQQIGNAVQTGDVVAHGGGASATNATGGNDSYASSAAATANPDTYANSPLLNSKAYDAGAVQQEIKNNPGTSPAASSGPSSGNRSTDTPPVVDTSSPTPLDDPSTNRSHFTANEVLDWHNKYINTDGVSARQEFDPQSGLPTNRNIVTMKDGSQQPISSAYILAHKNQNPGTSDDWETPPAANPNPVLGTDPARVAQAAALQSSAGAAGAFNAVAQQAIPNQTRTAPVMGPPSKPVVPDQNGATNPLLAALNPAPLPQAPGTTPVTQGGINPDAGQPVMPSVAGMAAAQSGLADGVTDANQNAGQAPADWASSPQATTAAINQVGSDPEASSAKKSGTRTDAGPAATPNPMAAPVNQAKPAPTPMPITAAGPSDAKSWSQWTGSDNPQDFGKMAFNPNNQVATGTLKDGQNGNIADWYDVKGQDGNVHRYYVDPARDGGRRSFASAYIRSGVVGASTLPNGSPDPNAVGFSEDRDYFDGTHQSYNNKPLEAELNQAAQLTGKWGTNPPGTHFMTNPSAVQEASYRAALQKENTTPMPEDAQKNIDNIWDIMQKGNTQKQLLASMGNKPHDWVAQGLSDWAANNGQRVPDVVAGLVKGASGIDLQHPDPQLTQLYQNHDNLASAVRALTASKSKSTPAMNEQMNQLIGDPKRNDYAAQLNNFLDNNVYTAAGRAVDIALANRQIIPQDFFDAQQHIHFGDTAPGMTKSNPIRINTPADDAKVAPGMWRYSATSRDQNPYQKGGVPKAQLYNPSTKPNP
jgi:hypothetical protein